MHPLVKKIKQVDFAYHMIQENDHIAVGISGGKDSSVLLWALHEYRKHSPKAFTVGGIHIKLGFGDDDVQPMVNFFKTLDIPIIESKSNIAHILKQHERNQHLPCSMCSRLKKGQVVKEAKNHGFNKIAFAHHADDAIETLFMNMIHGGKIATFDPVTYLSREDISLIRPLLSVREQHIIQTAAQLNIPIIASQCPNDKLTEREAIKNLLASIYSQYDKAEQNFLTMLSNSQQVKLWKQSKDEK